MAVTWPSLAYGLESWRSRATICASSAAWSISSSPASAFIRRTSCGSERSTMKSSPWSMNACTGPGGPLPMRSSSTARTLLEVVSGFCSEPESANSFSMIFWVSTNQVWSRPVRRMWCRVPSVSKPGVQRPGEAGAVCVEPHRRRPGDDPDRVHGPDRVPVADALDVVPHAVAVDLARAGRARDPEHPAVDVRRDAREHVRGRLAEPLGPHLAHELVVAADAARGGDHRLGGEGELAGLRPVAGLAALHGARGEDRAGDARDRPIRGGQRVDPVAEAQLDAP